MHAEVGGHKADALALVRTELRCGARMRAMRGEYATPAFGSA
jgi:hypothetical protein